MKLCGLIIASALGLQAATISFSIDLGVSGPAVVTLKPTRSPIGRATPRIVRVRLDQDSSQ